ncbi:MAG: oligosaccharide flippase family protein [Solirubrobacteraceae bacterium]|jgi:PST family polysaccharide transporter
MTDTKRTSLRALVRLGALWSMLDVVVNRTSSFLLGIVVARLLHPADFGVYAVALVVHAVLINVSDLGVGAIIVRDDDASMRASGPTVTTIALVNSVALGLLMALLAPVLAELLGAPRATAAIRVMAITVPLGGITAVPGGLLRREFKMKTMFVADSANNVASGIAVIALALAGAGPLALAWSFVAGQLLTAIILVAKSPIWFWPGWNRREMRRVLGFTMPMVGANVLGFTTQNVDYVIVGRLMGSVSLGLYLLAFNMSSWPQTVLGYVIKSVSLPAFARLKEGSGSMAAHFCRALRSIVRVTFPVCLILGALAHPLVLLVYGSRWEGASEALVGLVVLGAARTLVELFYDFLAAMGRNKAVLVVQLVWLPALACSLLLLVRSFGIAGAGVAQAAVSALLVVPLLVLCVDRASVPWRDVVRALLPTFSWALATGALGWYVASLIQTPVLACMAGGASSLAIYVLPYLTEVRRALTTERDRRLTKRTALAESPT